MSIKLNVRPEAPAETVENIRVLITDDHPLIRRALRDLIEKEPGLEVVGEAGNGQEAVELASKLRPDVIIMDIGMPGMSGLEATRQIKQTHPGIAVLVLTVHDDSAHVMALLQAGAAGYLIKTIFGEEVIHAIRAVVSGDSILSPSVLGQLMKQASWMTSKGASTDDGDKLSAREVQILKMAAKGMTNKDIAASLNLSARTVKGHFVNIFTKLNVGSRTEAVLAVMRAGLFTLDNLEG